MLIEEQKHGHPPSAFIYVVEKCDRYVESATAFILLSHLVVTACSACASRILPLKAISCAPNKMQCPHSFHYIHFFLLVARNSANNEHTSREFHCPQLPIKLGMYVHSREKNFYNLIIWHFSLKKYLSFFHFLKINCYDEFIS